jgi:circadian clock protein KaiC
VLAGGDTAVSTDTPVERPRRETTFGPLRRVERPVRSGGSGCFITLGIVRYGDVTGSTNSRVPVGIEGVDEVLNGGLLPGRAYMLRGDAGTGKTIVGFHYLAAGVAAGESCLFVAFEESEADVRANAAALGFGLDDVDILDLSPSADRFLNEEQYSVFAPDEVENRSVTDKIVSAVESVDPDRVFVDPITQLQYLSADDFQFRQEVAGLMSYLGDRGATTLFTTQPTPTRPDDDLQYICDGAVTLHRDASGRSLSVVKFRGSDFRSGHHALRIGSDGVSVFPKLVPGEHERTFDADKIGSGVDELDALLGGGVERGTVTVVSGPSGAGKSTTGTHFLAEAAGRGERAVAYLFEESEASLRHRARAIGLPVDEMVEAGDLALEYVEPLALSSDEFAHRVRAEVEDRGARVVMIDGTAGYRLSLRGDESTLVSELHGLARYLRNVGVTVILIEETGSVTGEFQPTREGISYLADNILFLRYLELGGEIRRAVGVLKKRLGPFEPTLRELRIRGDGLWIGEPLDGLRGILTGTPEWVDDGSDED